MCNPTWVANKRKRGEICESGGEKWPINGWLQSLKGAAMNKVNSIVACIAVAVLLFSSAGCGGKKKAQQELEEAQKDTARARKALKEANRSFVLSILARRPDSISGTVILAVFRALKT